MKATYVFAIIAFLSNTSAYARIGETFDEISQRYGQAEKQESNRMPGTEKYYFIKNGFGIEVMILDGKSVMEIFHRVEGKEISDDDIKELLKVNAEGHGWAFDKRNNQWTRSDIKISAFREPGHSNFFFMQDIAAAKQATKDAKTNLSGF